VHIIATFRERALQNNTATKYAELTLSRIPGTESGYNPDSFSQLKGGRIMFFRILLVLGMAVGTAAAQGPSKAQPAQNTAEGRFSVLSPWAEADPIPLKGISPRVDNLVGKKIGLFVNYKRAARPIGLSLEKRLKTMYPDSEIRFFYSPEWNVSEVETRNKDKFTAWAKGVDAVILLVGD
jgi:hypothetical protein